MPVTETYRDNLQPGTIAWAMNRGTVVRVEFAPALWAKVARVEFVGQDAVRFLTEFGPVGPYPAIGAVPVEVTETCRTREELDALIEADEVRRERDREWYE